MADKKISALTSATTPLAGTEVLPIVQSGATVKVAVSDLTAGRAISATSVTASTGNFVVGTSGQGIDFSATPGTGTSELLTDYEEGTSTVTLTPGTGSITLTANTINYTRIGRQVTITGRINVSAISSPSGTLVLAGLPFTVNAGIIGAVSNYASGLASVADGNVMADSWLGTNTVLNFSVDANQITTNTYLRLGFSYFV
jgi:hypothetical protein